MTRSIPRRVFIYWEQGFENAPETVVLSITSWRKLNPNHEIVLLDSNNVTEWFNGPKEIKNWNSLGVAHQSDLLRLALLFRFGGFWSDATLLCAKPLDEWIPQSLRWGFYMLHTPQGKNRYTQNFFLGSAKGSYFARRWFGALRKVAESSASVMTPATQKRWRKRRPILWANPLITSLWSILPWIRITGYPYLVAHYIANRLILTDPFAALTYREQPVIRAGEALHLQESERGAENFGELLRDGAYPLWKLTWRTSVNPTFWDSVAKDVRRFIDAIE